MMTILSWRDAPHEMAGRAHVRRAAAPFSPAREPPRVAEDIAASRQRYLNGTDDIFSECLRRGQAAH